MLFKVSFVDVLFICQGKTMCIKTYLKCDFLVDPFVNFVV